MRLIWFHRNAMPMVLNLVGRQVYKHHHQILPKHATGHPDGVVSGLKMTGYNNPVAYSTMNTILEEGEINTFHCTFMGSKSNLDLDCLHILDMSEGDKGNH
jgi:hypothetical protein